MSHSSLLDLTKQTKTHNWTWIGESPLIYRTNPTVVQLTKHQQLHVVKFRSSCASEFFFFFTRVDKATFLSNRTLFSRRAWSICPQPHPPHSFGAYSQYCSSHPPCISTASHSLLFRALLVLLFLIPPWSPPPSIHAASVPTQCRSPMLSTWAES